MASSPQATLLSEAHRAQQQQENVRVALTVQQFWSIVQANDLERTGRLWLAALLPRLRDHHRRKMQLTRGYYEAFRAVEFAAAMSPRPAAPAAAPRPGAGGQPQRDRPAPFVMPTLPTAPELNVEQMQTSLAATGLWTYREKMRVSVPEPRARQDAVVASIGAATRILTNDVHEALERDTKADPAAVGYVRVVRANGCSFCAMLASRGPVYKDDSFDFSDPRFVGNGSHKVHDHCNCSLEPVFSRSAPWPGESKQWQDLWNSATKGLSGQAALNAFRRAYEGR